MELIEIQSAIVKHFFSEDLKRYIEENGHVFTGFELLSLADHFAPSLQEKLRLASLIAGTDDEAALRARAYVEEKTAGLNAFMTPGVNEVYELTIQDSPDAYAEKYLCAAFDIAKKTIDDYYDTYSDKPDNDVTFTVEKRRIRMSGDGFSEDYVAACVLNSQKQIRTLDVREDLNADEMHLPLPEFPAFLPPVAPVKYIDNTGKAAYGVYIDLDRPPTETCLIIPFDSKMLKGRDYRLNWPVCRHEHIPCPDVETVPLAVLGENVQEDYFSFLAWWEEFSGKN